MAGSRRPKALGAYIFAGGYTLGVQRHFDVVAHLEDGNFGVATARANFDFPVYDDPDEWPDKMKVDFVYANPPCAPWSRAAGRPKGAWQSDPRVSCWRRAFELVALYGPKVWACESVRGVYTDGRALMDEFSAAGRRMGYATTHLLVDALNHGIPQVRRRYFLVLHRVELPWVATGLKRTATVRDALKGRFRTRTEMNVSTRDYMKLVKHLKPNERMNQVFDAHNDDPVVVDGKIKGRPSNFVRRLDLNSTSPVIGGRVEMIHPTEHRFISVEEQAALCGYPRDFRFVGSVSSQFAQIGKAVTPAVGEYVARVVAAGIARRKASVVMSPRQVTIHRDKIEEVDV